MDNDFILHEMSEDQYQLAAADNLFALFRSMSVLPGYESVESDDLCYHGSFPINPMFHGVWRPRLTVDNADAAIDNALDWHKRRGAPLVFWFNDPDATPADLGERVLGKGFIPFETDAPCMVADLATLDPGHLDRVPAGFTIEHVTDDSGARAFAEGFVGAYGLPSWAATSWEDATNTIGADRSPWRMYVGWLDGRPVAVNMLLLGAGFAGLYAVGVLPDLRRQGIGAAITVRPLIDAREAGYRFGALFSSQIGKPVYERIGFRDTGARISRYLWIAPGVSLDTLS